jgi:hypothetical protein
LDIVRELIDIHGEIVEDQAQHEEITDNFILTLTRTHHATVNRNSESSIPFICILGGTGALRFGVTGY